MNPEELLSLPGPIASFYTPLFHKECFAVIAKLEWLKLMSTSCRVFCFWTSSSTSSGSCCFVLLTKFWSRKLQYFGCDKLFQIRFSCLLLFCVGNTMKYLQRWITKWMICHSKRDLQSTGSLGNQCDSKVPCISTNHNTNLVPSQTHMKMTWSHFAMLP